MNGKLRNGRPKYGHIRHEYEYEYEGLEDMRRLKAFIPHLNFSKLFTWMDALYFY